MNRLRLVFVVMSAVALSVAPAPAMGQAGGTVHVINAHVAAEKHQSEFVEPTDKGLNDSVADITRAVAAVGSIKVVPSTVSADLDVEVVGRYKQANGGGIVGMIIPNGFGGFSPLFAPSSRTSAFVLLRFRVGDYSKELVGEARSGRWTDAAENAVDQLRKWVDANRSKLMERRSQK